jgi:riboflavin biosynthesis pyrimidine reductase
VRESREALLVQILIEYDLVDEFRVMLDPLVVGGGKRIFRDDGELRPLRLLDHKVTTTGATLTTYAAAHSAGRHQARHGERGPHGIPQR